MPIGAIYSATSGSATQPTVVSNNIISNFSSNTSTGTFTGIQNGSTASGNTVTINGNMVQNITLQTTTGTLHGINYSTATNLNLTNNTINNLTRNIAGTTYGLYSGGSPVNETITGNTISNISSTSTANTVETMRGIYLFTTGGTKIISNNTVNNLSIATINGGVILEGIRAAYGTDVTVSQNTVSNLSGNAFILTGIYAGAGTNTYVVSRNRIYNLATIASNPVVTGIINAGGVFTARNNFISDLRATGSSNANSVVGIHVNTITTNSSTNLFHNTIYLGNASIITGASANFGGAGILVSTTNAAIPVVLRNNIVNVNGTNSAGYFAALKRASTGTAGTKPANITASNNIYNATYIYGEGNTLGGRNQRLLHYWRNGWHGRPILQHLLRPL